jgi:hypothetical protein
MTQLVRIEGLGLPSRDISFLNDTVKKPDKRYVHLAVLGEAEVVGEEFLLTGSLATFTATCDSEECEM